MDAVESVVATRPPSLGARLRAHPVVKAAGLTCGMTVFFVAYFAVLSHPRFPVTVVPELALDRAIPFSPGWVLPYFSLWVYVSLYPSLLTERRELVHYAVAAIGLSIAGLAIFFFWPTVIAQPAIDWTQYPSVAFLKTVDAAGNVCPSLHVAFAAFTACALQRLLIETGVARACRWLSLLWACAIIYSTLAIKQHVTLDVAAGLALGLGVGAVHSRSLRRSTSKFVQDRRCPQPVGGR